MITYGTPEGLRDFMFGAGSSEPVPADATLLLRKASALVLDATKAAVYRTTPDGYPVAPAYLDTLTSATYTQAEAWSRAGITPGTTLVEASSKRVVASKSLGGASVSYVQNDTAAAAWNALASGEYLIASAYQLLEQGGLVSTSVQSLRAGADIFVMPWPYDAYSGRYVGPGDVLP